ncbi:MAG: type III-A CRISPR-associated protein Cas10/Csm1 [Nitrospira sp.]|nr:type III-A CRISPR-associated protein Cas10/Csm1 [Nitrospira sp.]MCP9443540.1 type III-A CRISPR-associated protein Cas10/Csm1 [Nitrospira sp.]
MSQFLDASCRVAIAALLHDLGKFAERARIPEAEQRDTQGTTRLDVNVPLYCPAFQGRHTHIHAAYTAIAMDLLEQHFPELVGEDMTPFAPWRQKNADDSIINAAACHHKPDTFMQWVIATADRLASGFERDQFSAYNEADEGTATKKNHYTARQLTLLEQIRLEQAGGRSMAWRYPLKPLSPTSIFPVTAEGYEQDDKEAAQREYRELWEEFIKGLERIPPSHRRSLPLWLDHFESCWLAYAHAIPSATAFGVKPEVSLYDHAKAVSALAVALWRWHDDRGDTGDAARGQLRAMWDKERKETPEAEAAWAEQKFLLVQGDFFGIQDFIFATGGETQRQAAKLLRGRSFYVSLLTECAALKVLEALDLPPTSQVINAAGKFLIVAPNAQDIVQKLQAVQGELNRWFLEHTFGQSGIGLAWLPAAAADFRRGEKGESPFRDLMKRLFEQLETAKLQRFDLCRPNSAHAAFTGFLDRFENTKGACDIDGRSPAKVRLEGDREIWVSELAADQIMTGKWLAGFDRILITRESLDHHTLRLPLFGYWVSFTANEEATGRFGKEAESGNLVRAWDFSLPASGDQPLWNGYARRHINAYVARTGDLNDYDRGRYKGLETPESPEEPKTLNHLALDDRRQDPANPDRWIGTEAVMTLKGDVDNLGLIFQKGLEQPTFAKMAALSRQMNAFFAIWLPWACRDKFPNTYTVFAGGDDFFLIGPWRSTISLALHMRNTFQAYVAANPDLHFSAGLSMTKPGFPIRDLGRLAEEALEKAKGHKGKQVNGTVTLKNAVTCFDVPVTWDDFDDLMKREAELTRLTAEHRLSTGYLYDLLTFTAMAGKVAARPENAIWHSRFAYHTRRLVETKIKRGESRAAIERERRALQDALASEIAGNGIAKHGAAYTIALFTHLYQQRD